MPDQRKPPNALERSLVRLARAALGVPYVGVALLGVLRLDPWTTLLVALFLGVLATGLRWSVHQAVHPEATPSIDLLLPAATVGALSAPFQVGIQQLGEPGAYLLLVQIGLLAILGCHWIHRLDVPTGQAVVGDRHPSPPRPTEAAGRELLQALALDDLVNEWRRSDELFHLTSRTDRRAAVAWRGPPRRAGTPRPARFRRLGAGRHDPRT